jgi:cytochrome c peroxidase
MHDGRFKKLRDVIDHYTNQIDLNDPYLSGELRKKIVLSDDEKKDLIAFLKTLTDREFLYNKRFRPSR